MTPADRPKELEPMMKKSPTRARDPRGRSRVTNGSSLFNEPVPRGSKFARRFSDVISELTKVQGLSIGEMDEEQRSAIRRIASMTVRLEGMEAALARGEPIDDATYGVLVGHVSRCFAKLEAKRVEHERRIAAEAAENGDDLPQDQMSRWLRSLSDEELHLVNAQAHAKLPKGEPPVVPHRHSMNGMRRLTHPADYGLEPGTYRPKSRSPDTPPLAADKPPRLDAPEDLADEIDRIF